MKKREEDEAEKEQKYMEIEVTKESSRKSGLQEDDLGGVPRSTS